ncbi:23S rRNA (adenine(2503)-C(2))-methyltransferase RlmN [Lachnospiraceae bacterium OttesenSCG-928-E19]|nr:23S rRNA (adenine(2503)-C(2))-methyltransferase RlmN [Lachnospiraceae bacterium OttesenSCG-928-E19]
MNKKEIKSYSFEELVKELELLGEKKFRGKQIYEWLHVKLVDSFDEMSNLPKSLREKLNEHFDIGRLKIVERQVSKQDGTNKFLFALADGHVVESVLMRYKHGNSVCISSQVGCRMGCVFCASTIGGLSRNLSTAEMLDQVYSIQKQTGERVSNIVIMGTGEPLDNYDSFLKFVQMVSDDRGLNISQRNITVSTCGLIDEIRKLAEEQLQITLALSLHGSSQEKRERLMPIARKNELSEVLDACDYYFEKTGRRISCEYSLVEGVNDRKEDVDELVGLLKHRKFHVNLIPVNPIKERNFVRPSRKNAEKFQNMLEMSGINVTIRREMGTDIDGACGQLRRKHIE